MSLPTLSYSLIHFHNQINYKQDRVLFKERMKMWKIEDAAQIAHCSTFSLFFLGPLITLSSYSYRSYSNSFGWIFLLIIGLILIFIVIWIAVVYWVYKDANYCSYCAKKFDH
jgi:hypothetical protein